MKNYDHIFTKPLRNRLATAWKSEFWDRDQGVCLGTGMVWFDVPNDGASYKLKTINFSAGPNDIDGILGKIKTEEKEKANSDAIANLYSDLGRAYKDDWRCYGDERVKIEKPICLKKAELAFSKAISLRTGNKSKSAEQAKDLWLLADTLQEETGKAEMAESNFLKSLAMQQAVLPPAAPSIGSTLDKLKELDADAPLKLDAVLKMELPFKEASIQAKEKSLTAKTSNTKKKELADNYIQLGDIYSRLNRKDEAQKSYGKAYVLWKGMNPKNEELSTDLTRVFAEQGKVAEAKNICSSISDFTFKTMAEDSLILGLAKSGKFAEAEKLLSAEVSKIESDHSGERDLQAMLRFILSEKNSIKRFHLLNWL